MASIRNITTVKDQLRKAGAVRSERLYLGLVDAGKYLLRESQKIVPVDYGILKASGFVRGERSAIKPRVVVGYTAPHALYVHEGAPHDADGFEAAHGQAFNEKYAAQLDRAKALRKKRHGGTTGPFRHNRGPDQQAHFLSMPLRRDRAILMGIVAKRVKGG